METNEQPTEVQIPVPWGHVAGCLYESSSHRNKAFRPILTLHGWQDNAGSFARLAPLVAPYIPILAIDLPGHGRSSHYPPGMIYNLLDYVSLIKYIMEYYQWPKVSLMAHSMGGIAGFVFASIYPNDVDMIISLDILSPRYFKPSLTRQIYQYCTERRSKEFLVTVDQRPHNTDVDRKASQPRNSQPLYTMAQMENLLHKGSNRSIDLETCKYILARSAEASKEKPGFYYFVRDHRLRYFGEFMTHPELTLELARQIGNINFLVVAPETSELVNDDALPVIDILRENCESFELRRIPDCTHHLHLNNAEIVAEYIIPFLEKHRQNDDSVNASCKL